MDNILGNMKKKGYCIVYMDDIMIYADTREKLHEATLELFDIIAKNDLFFKAEKCVFAQTKVPFLGMIIEHNKVSMDPAKVQGIADWPEPTNVKELRAFLGFGNFYQKFIARFAELAHALYALLQKGVPFTWGELQRHAFQSMKKQFTEEPVLMIPNPTRPFQIESDASKHATGALLTQMDRNGDRHPCAFISKTFSPAERNYKIYDRELLALVRALTEWRHYIHGSPHSTIALSDHKNLTYWRSPQKLNCRQARWHLFISEFNLELVHVPGSKMYQSDALSRRPDHIPDGDTDNEDVTMLPDSLFVNLIDTELQQQIADSKILDTNATEALKLLLEDGPTELTDDLADWTTEDLNGKPMLFYQGRQYIPKDDNLRRQITKQFHYPITAGHPRELATYIDMARFYWWPGMRTFVKNYVKGCAICQQFKINRSPTKPALMPIPGPESDRPFANCSMDLITDLPISDGYNSVMIVVDHGLTKGVILFPTNKTQTAAKTASMLLDRLYSRFGLPDKFISDRGPQFAAKAFQELLKLLEIKSSLSTAYHPQSDGATERVNQEIEAYVSIYCSLHPDTWASTLPTLEFTHNNRRHADRTHTPFELMYGITPRAIPLTFNSTKFPTVKAQLDTLKRAQQEALAAHELARIRMLERFKRDAKPFKKGDKVWLDARNLKTAYPKKFAPKREGPFKITEVLGPLTYRLDIPKRWKIHNMFHATLLSLFRQTDVHGPSFSNPPPDLIDGKEEYEVEVILNHRKIGRGYQYLIRWKNYSSGDDSWEPESHIKNADEMLSTYKKKHKLRHISINHLNSTSCL